LENTVNVTVNDYQGAYDAVSHLEKQGYKRIAHLSGPSNLAISKRRKEGYLRALADAGLPSKPQWIVECPSGSESESYKITLELFKNPTERPDAIFAHHDIVAAGAMIAIKSLGLRIPEDVGVVGYSDWQFSSMIDPPLSTVSQPGFKIGEHAANLLLEMISGKNSSQHMPQNVVLDTELIIRKSSVRNS
jgi:LacI family transcriptional regulator